MGFLSAYEGTERFKIDHPEKDYWIDLKQYISQAEKEKAEREIQTMRVVDGKPVMTPDIVKAQQLLVLASIADWNLDDANGTVWPIDMAHVRKLPDVVYDQLLKKVDVLTKPAPAAEKARFPGEGVVGDPDGDARAAVTADVPDGAAAVAAPWSEA
jgi:hypothetical protein